MDVHKDAFLDIQINDIYNSTPEPSHYSRLIKFESLKDRSTVQIGNHYAEIGVVQSILIILGISLCTLCLYFMYKRYKQNKAIQETKKRTGLTLPLPQV